jgi:hypothetical protein
MHKQSKKWQDKMIHNNDHGYKLALRHGLDVAYELFPVHKPPCKLSELLAQDFKQALFYNIYIK